MNLTAAIIVANALDIANSRGWRRSRCTAAELRQIQQAIDLLKAQEVR